MLDKKKLKKADSNMQLMIVSQNLEVSEMTEEQIEFTTDFIVKNIKLNKLEELITDIVKDLSSVGAPTWNADMEYIAMDNQKRLEIIYSLTNDFQIVKNWVKNLKKNKYKCYEDFDKKYSLVDYTVRLFKTIISVPRFKYISMIKDNITLLILQGNLKQVKELQEGLKRLGDGENG